MKLEKNFKGKVLYFKEAFGRPWTRILCVPAGGPDSLIEKKQKEFLESYSSAEFKVEVM